MKQFSSQSKSLGRIALIAAAFCSLAIVPNCATTPAHADQHILNVSYDPTRELYKAFNASFAAYWQKTNHEVVTIDQSHGGSAKQAQAVINGLDADVVTLALAPDIDEISKAGLIAPNWQTRFPHNSTPYTSTVLFLVRAGNPKHIHDWSDLTQPGLQIVTPNPKTSGGARYEFLGAYGWAWRKYHSDAKALDFVKAIYKNVPVLDTGSRAATVSFAQRGVGDVLLCWENEAFLAKDEFGASNFNIVVPSETILAEPPVAVVDKNAAAHNTTALATAYLKYLYSPEGQTIAAQHYYRPRDKKIAAQFASQFPKVKLFDIGVFGGWTRAQKVFFDDGGVFDQIYKP
jgi:sulfate/thiosulfate-binding protein